MAEELAPVRECIQAVQFSLVLPRDQRLANILRGVRNTLVEGVTRETVAQIRLIMANESYNTFLCGYDDLVEALDHVYDLLYELPCNPDN
jgi:hypothetical protein